MAIPTTTTSALASITGAAGDMYLNTDTKQFVLFHSAGTGSSYYSQFSNDGTVGASIELTFNDQGMGPHQVYDMSQNSSAYVSASELSGKYKRFDQHSEAITAINAETQMSTTSGVPNYEIPGNSAVSMNQAPYLYQADGANASDPTYGLTRNNGQVFVYTGATQGGAITSQPMPWTDMMGGTGTWNFIPVIYLINGPLNVAGPLWGMTLVVQMGSAINSLNYSDPNQSSQEWGNFNWGSGYVTPGNNEATVRQSLSSVYVTPSGGSPSWTVDQTYLP